MNARTFVATSLALLGAITLVSGCGSDTTVSTVVTEAPILPPQNVIVKQGPSGDVFLSWDANTQSILQGYNVYRRDTSAGEIIEQTIAPNPQGQWIFIADQLNTHKSESLVHLVIKLCGLDIDPETLGLKGKSGILKSMTTRKTFLEDESHPIRFVYTPKHTSWLNQVEIWFSILVRKLLKRDSPMSEAAGTGCSKAGKPVTITSSAPGDS